jgi:hypothetical protein
MIQFQVVNVYDEVLQDSVRISGNLGILRKDTRDSVVVPFTSATIYPPPVRSIITLQPGDTTNIYVGWDHYLREGVPVWLHDWDSRSMRLAVAPGYGFGYSTDTVRFSIAGEIQFMKNVQATNVTPFNITAVYRLFPKPWGP